MTDSCNPFNLSKLYFLYAWARFFITVYYTYIFLKSIYKSSLSGYESSLNDGCDNCFIFMSGACQPVLLTSWCVYDWVFCQYVIDVLELDLLNGYTFKMLTLLTMNHSMELVRIMSPYVNMDTLLLELGGTNFPNIACY